MKSFEAKTREKFLELEKKIKEGGGGGSKTYTVNFIFNEDYTEVSTDKTVKEIISAYRDGYTVIGYMTTSYDSMIMPLVMTWEDAVEFSVFCYGAAYDIYGEDGAFYDQDSDIWYYERIECTTRDDVINLIDDAIGYIENRSY